MSDCDFERELPMDTGFEASQTNLLEKKTYKQFVKKVKKSGPIGVFERLASQSFEKTPAMLKSMKKGKLDLDEAAIQENQINALAEAASHFDTFIDDVKNENSSMIDEQLGAQIKQLSLMPNLQHITIGRAKVGEKTLQMLRLMLNKRIPYNLKELVL